MPDESKLKALFEGLLAKVGADELPPEDVEQVNENLATILEVADVLHGIFGDGLQLADVAALGTVIEPLMKLAAGFSQYKGEDKRRFVTEVVWLLYKVVDTYPDGKRNNVNIPFLAGSWERKVERAVLAFAAGMAIDAIYDRLKDEGEV